MNNDFFRRLVNDGDGKASKKEGTKGGSGKTTKEIAREAVEEEFKERKRKRGRDDDYLSDDDDDDDDEDDDDRDKRKEKEDATEMADIEAKKKEKEKKNKNKKIKYRNRAKERREGKTNADYQDSTAAVNHLDEEMSKYLGGDEAHTHLVKGLDKTLADKVRREVNGPGGPTEDLDLDKIMEEASSAKAKAAHKVKMAATPKQINELCPNQSTPLTTGMLSYLKKLEGQKQKQSMDVFGSDKAETISQAGDTISRTTLKFSLDANVGDRFKSWELPQETMTSASQHERMRGRSAMTTCTPLDHNLINKIKTVFSAMKRKAGTRTPSTKKVDANKKMETVQIAKTRDKVSVPGVADKTIAEDSDDDIFGDIGDYVPPKEVT
jgi:hypothetical protein